eukprot:NODE_44_length_33449_cov_1.575742.p33 type:complete len:144 gc:universal NODE_44_length_33449_cov_1.575742:9739-10170(+)
MNYTYKSLATCDVNMIMNVYLDTFNNEIDIFKEEDLIGHCKFNKNEGQMALNSTFFDFANNAKNVTTFRVGTKISGVMKTVGSTNLLKVGQRSYLFLGPYIFSGKKCIGSIFKFENLFCLKLDSIVSKDFALIINSICIMIME